MGEKAGQAAAKLPAKGRSRVMTLRDDELRIRAEVVANLPALIEKAILARSWQYEKPTEEGFVIGHDFCVLFQLDGVRFSVRIVVGEHANGCRELDYAEHARIPANGSDNVIGLAELMKAFEQ
jgi:hypothetical protein